MEKSAGISPGKAAHSKVNVVSGDDNVNDDYDENQERQKEESKHSVPDEDFLAIKNCLELGDDQWELVYSQDDL